MTPMQRILLTGAAGGIGRATALAFAAQGHHLALVDRDEAGLIETARLVTEAGGQAHALTADLSDLQAADGIVDEARRRLGGLDVLVNNAGLIGFRPFERESVDTLRKLMDVNLLAPMLLARRALAHMRAQGKGRIVNVGSIFGSIGFAWFASYSTSKFAVRGFSESLRRELAGTGIEVTYVAPRATRTGLASVFGRMADAVGMTMDDPAHVAARIVKAVQKGSKDVYVGFPECVFVRLNALLPRFVDKALRKQDATTRPFALEAADAAEAAAAVLSHASATPSPRSERKSIATAASHTPADHP